MCKSVCGAIWLLRVIRVLRVIRAIGLLELPLALLLGPASGPGHRECQRGEVDRGE